jgi:hypothetical protein
MSPPDRPKGEYPSVKREGSPSSQFAFLQGEWPTVHDAAARAETAAHADPRTACFYARRALELAVAWAYKHDAALKLPYQDKLSALIHEPSFKQAAGEAVFSKARVINTLGNRAVHGLRAIPQGDAMVAVRELFHVAYWFARTYGRAARPAPGLVFDAAALPRAAAAPGQTTEQLQRLEAGLRERDEKLAAVLADRSTLDEALKRLRAEVAAAKQAATAQPDTHDYSEAETRDYFIDLLLKEAGWPLDQPRDREFEVSGMPNTAGKGFVDYVVWGDDGRPLGLVEAKRTRRDARVGQQQAKLYADCLERQFGQRPLIFYSNGKLAGLLEEKSAIPMVRDQMALIQEALIQDIQTDEWWQDVTVPMLEGMRRRLRDLIKLIEQQQRKPIYTDFEDEMGDETEVELPGLGLGTDRAKFRAKAQAFLRAHQDHLAIHKLRMNKALTAADLAELQRILGESGVGAPEDIQRAAEESQGLGLFVRSLVGMDRSAAKEAMATFLTGKSLSANQIEFVNLVVDHLTEQGIVAPERLYERGRGNPITEQVPEFINRHSGESRNPLKKAIAYWMPAFAGMTG